MQGVIFVLLLMPALANAGKIIESSVALEKGVYLIDVKARINTSPKHVFQFITDYEKLPLLNPSISESSITHTYSPLRHRVRTVISACILFFCRTVLQVQDVEQLSHTQVTASIVPELSDFSYGWAEWELNSAGQGTIMQFTAELEPSFWVPPIIGPWLFKRKIVSELLESATVMEMTAMQPVAP